MKKLSLFTLFLFSAVMHGMTNNHDNADKTIPIYSEIKTGSPEYPVRYEPTDETETFECLNYTFNNVVTQKTLTPFELGLIQLQFNNNVNKALQDYENDIQKQANRLKSKKRLDDRKNLIKPQKNYCCIS